MRIAELSEKAKSNDMLTRTEGSLMSQGQSIGSEIISPRVRNTLKGEKVCRYSEETRRVRIKSLTLTNGYWRRDGFPVQTGSGLHGDAT